MNTRLKIFLIFCSCLILISSSCRIDRFPFYINGGIVDPNYPTILKPLTSAELSQLQKEFNELNDHKIQTQLNKYGFTGKWDFSISHPNPDIPLSKSQAINLAIQCIFKNKKFTNVNDTTLFRSSLIHSSKGNIEGTEWILRFSPQVLKGYEVITNFIAVLLYGDGVYCISGFWYPDIYIPEIDIISIDGAKQIISGQKIIWYDIMGNPVEFIVSDDKIGNNIIKTIYPIIENDLTELRLTWKIPILFDDWVGWHIYVDTMTGEIISTIQEFRT